MRGPESQPLWLIVCAALFLSSGRRGACEWAFEGVASKGEMMAAFRGSIVEAAEADAAADPPKFLEPELARKEHGAFPLLNASKRTTLCVFFNGGAEAPEARTLTSLHALLVLSVPSLHRVLRGFLLCCVARCIRLDVASQRKKLSGWGLGPGVPRCDDRRDQGCSRQPLQSAGRSRLPSHDRLLMALVCVCSSSISSGSRKPRGRSATA